MHFRLTLATAVMAIVLYTSAVAGVAPGPTTPSVFAPGVISGPLDDASPAFAPDGKTVFFMRGDNSWMLMESHLKNGKWSLPRTAPFSGRWRDLDPAMAPDGSYLLFVSNRPATSGGKPLDVIFKGKVYPGVGMNIWRVNREGGGWSTPVRLPPSINSSTSTFAPSIAADGSLYYIGRTDPKGPSRLLRSRYRDGRYLPPTPVAIGGPNDWIRDPAIAPDQSFIVFSIVPAGSKQKPRLAIAFREDNGWSKPIDLGDSVNGPGSAMGSQLGPDHRTLYFYSPRKAPAAGAVPWNNGRSNIWRISLIPWLHAHHAAIMGTHKAKSRK